MVSTTDLLQRVYEVLVELIDGATSVSEPTDHVDVLNRIEDIKTPFFGFEWTASADGRGLGGNRRPIGATPDETNNVYEVTFARDYTMSLDLAAIAEGDSPRQRTEYMDTIQQQFGYFVDNPTELHADVNRVREGNITPSAAGDTLNTSARVTFEVDYMLTETEDFPLADVVNLDVDVDGLNTYPEKYDYQYIKTEEGTYDIEGDLDISNTVDVETNSTS